MKMRRKRGSPVWAFVRDAGWWRVAAGVTDRLWEIGDIVALVEAMDAVPGKRGPYKKADAEISN
jgi:hypothetical protein